MEKKFLVLLFLGFFILEGCVKQVDTVMTNTTYDEEVDAYLKSIENEKPTPSLWSDMGRSGTLFLDYKARKIGDIVIVQIVETSSASNSNTTNTTKQTNYSAGVNNFLGMPMDFGMTNFLGQGNAFDPSLGAQSNNSFSGNGSKKKSDTVQATIASRIIEILPSGNLVVEGNREIVVDQEKQVITIKGVIRQKDIDSNNMVLSSSIADAQITYSGKGILTNVNKKGWLANAVDWAWPF